MPVTIGLDIGTTSISAIALDTGTGVVAASGSLANDAIATPPTDAARGRSEWDAERMLHRAGEVLRSFSSALGPRAAEVAGLAITGQQHGVVLADRSLRPVSPFVGWQDRRGDEKPHGAPETWVDQARLRIGGDARPRAGCDLATGFMGVTLFHLRETAGLPADATACFITDYAAALMTGRPPVTDPTMAASSGLLDLQTRGWHDEAIGALGLPRALFPPVREAGDLAGTLTREWAEATGLPRGLPVLVGLGDNQASFLGSVATPGGTVLVNVGTGAQVARYTDTLCGSPAVETRPFARRGYLLVHAGLSGGRSYAALERFLRGVVRDLMGAEPQGELYERMNALAAEVPPGAGGLVCDPLFAGTRQEPGRRATLSGMSDGNLTAGHLVRSVLEGMARSYREGSDRLAETLGSRPDRLVGAGNALRRNPVLATCVAAAIGLPMRTPVHVEEAAFGAALVAGTGAGIWPSLEAASRVVRYAA